jgi:hypothetical protein
MSKQLSTPTKRPSVAPPPSLTATRRSVLQRKCACGGTPGPTGECAECRKNRLQRRSTGQAEPSTVPPIVHEVLRSPGQPLDPATRAFMEPRFGHDFSSVRVHTDARAAESAHAVSADAYTVGRDIVFDTGRHASGTTSGRELLAHELAHVVQQGGGATGGAMRLRVGAAADPAEAEARQAARLMGGRSTQQLATRPTMLQRQERREEEQIEGQDPSFLVCMALCELGIPPAMWRTITREFLEAVWEEYRQQYDQARANAEFRAFQTAFRLYSPIRVMKTVLAFILEGKIGLIPVHFAATEALRTRLTERLIARGATEAGIRMAAQIVRRVALAIEVAIAAGCTVYCGGTAYGRLIAELTDAVAQGATEALNVLGVLGQAGNQLLQQVFLRPVLVAWATVDPTNWDLSGLPGRLGADLGALGLYLWYRLEADNPDQFLANSTRPLRSYPIPVALIRAIVSGMSQAASTRTGFTIEFTTDTVLDLTPLTFAQLLRDWRILRFRRDPERVADEALAGAPERE